MRLIDADRLLDVLNEHNLDGKVCIENVIYAIKNAPTVHKVSDGIVEYKRAIELMAEYIVTLGGVDYHLCDEIPKEIHLKHQPQNDGNYENEPCFKCVAEYFLNKAGEQE